MSNERNDVLINLTAVIVAVTDNRPRVLVVNPPDGSGPSLPTGPFDPVEHDSLESGLRQSVEAQTGLDLFYVEQLYTFGNRYRDSVEIAGGPRLVSVAYLALTREDDVRAPNAEWWDWYSFLPWEDWRTGRPAIIAEQIEPALRFWVNAASGSSGRQKRQERVNVTFGTGLTAEMDAVLSLERFELLYTAGVVAEAWRNRGTVSDAERASLANEFGEPLRSDHRRILASAIGRLRGKLAYRPVVFELMPPEFTLLQLQHVVEALSGGRLHKQNFRRLVINADLVEAVGRTTTVGRGRPAKLFRFRREVLGEKLTAGLARPIMRSGDN